MKKTRLILLPLLQNSRTPWYFNNTMPVTVRGDVWLQSANRDGLRTPCGSATCKCHDMQIPRKVADGCHRNPLKSLKTDLARFPIN